MKVFVLALTVTLISLSSAVILQPLSLSGVIPGRFIVKLKDGVASRAFVNSKSLRNNDGVLADLKNNVQFTYDTAFNGFSASLDDSQLRSLDSLAEVDYIEPDQIAMADGQIQSGSTWGLARTSSIRTISGSAYNYYYKTSSGTGATVYVLDTGINTAHRDFGGRAVFGYSSITGESNDDLNGHGTHVAGTVGGNTYGIAKKATLVAVKVLGKSGSGTWSGIIAGIDWVVKNAPSTRAVINMSIGGGASTAVDDAVANAVRAGITTVVSAGNSATNACNQSPARSAPAITVAASDVNDKSASFTNYGSCVDTYAPGVSVLSAWIGSTTATNTISGTSMASPHVAGLAAYFIREYNLTTPTAVENKIKDYATRNAISSAPSGTPNLVIFNGGNGVHVVTK
jgi:subtilisin family serine protease